MPAAQVTHRPARVPHTGCVLLLFLLTTALLLPPLALPCFSREEAEGTPDEGFDIPDEQRMTLTRQRDPIVMRNTALGALFDGEPVKNVALYAYHGGRFQPIPFQFDFIGEDGLVIPGYVNRVMEKAVYDFHPNKDLPERLVPPYELLFMVRDMGDHYPTDGIPHGFKRAMEIRVQEPQGTGSGWVYLMESEGQPTPVDRDYVNYTLIQRGEQYIEQIRGESYTSGFPDADKPFAYGYWAIPPEAGGTGVNILQTFRLRVHLSILFLNLELDPKNNIVPYVIGYNDGPVRVTRRMFSSIVIAGIKMDRLSFETESHYYGSYFFFDGEVSLPELVKKISRIRAMFTTDFSANATGMKWYNAANQHMGGIIVDGRMSPMEEALDRSPYLWSLIVGEPGGWANILEMHTESVRPNMDLFYLDHSAYRSEKDRDVDGTWASTGYYLERLDKVEEVVRFRTTILAIPADFQLQDTQELVNLVYHPPHAHVERTWRTKP